MLVKAAKRVRWKADRCFTNRRKEQRDRLKGARRLQSGGGEKLEGLPPKHIFEAKCRLKPKGESSCLVCWKSVVDLPVGRGKMQKKSSKLAMKTVIIGCTPARKYRLFIGGKENTGAMAKKKGKKEG